MLRIVIVAVIGAWLGGTADAGPSKPPADQAIAAAKSWLAAVAAKDADKLAAAIEFPYWQSGTALGKTEQCRGRLTAASKKDLATASKCLFEYQPLVKLVAALSDGQAQEIAVKELPDELKAYKKQFAGAEPSHRLIQVELEADYHVVLVLAVRRANGRSAVDVVVGALL
jgi:hypothetical protein